MSYTVDFNRYIFFDSLFNDAPQLAANVQSHYANVINTIKNPTNKYQDNPLDYIKDFLTMIKQLADRERASELKYLNSKHKDSIKSYISPDTNQFDYLEFIKDLNLTKQGINVFKETINTNINNFLQVESINENLRKNPITYNYKEKNSDNTRTQIGTYDTAKQLYQTKHENEYRALMTTAAKQYGIKIRDTVNQQFAKEVETEFKSLSHSSTLMLALAKIIRRQTTSLQQLQQALLSIAIQNIDYKKITGNISKELNFAELKRRIKQDLNSSYKNILSQESAKLKNLEDFITTIAKPNSTGTGLSKFKNQLQNQLYRLSNDKSGSPSNQLYNLINEFLKKLEAPEGMSEAKIKENFSKKAFKLVKEQQNILKSKNNQATDAEILQELKKVFIPKDINPNDVNEILHRTFSLDSISGADMAELRSAVEAAIKQQGMDIFLPGKKIQFKIDLTYTYHFNNVDINDFNITKTQKQELQELVNLVDHFGQRFLEAYSKASNHGNTDVQLAYSQYIQLLKQLGQKRKQIAKNLSQKDLQNLDKILNTLFTDISVKEYQFYNNDVGYAEGSLGGNGLVVSAVPNLLRMLQLGGISVPDADIIIGALLNSFSSSVLGTSIFDDIKNFLAAGAAMMLFDDGFTAGQTFLNEAKSVLESDVPGTMHLLLLNNVYMPQSYVLQNIYENLVEVYGKMNDTFKDLSSGKRITSTKVKSEIYLNNPMNYSNLNKVYQEETSMQEKWNKVSAEAQSSVKISFFFMAGMLDILEGLQAAFK